jgi:hypothetical protein
VKETITVNPSNVTGMKPALIINSLLCLLHVIEVSHADMPTIHANLEGERGWSKGWRESGVGVRGERAQGKGWRERGVRGRGERKERGVGGREEGLEGERKGWRERGVGVSGERKERGVGVRVGGREGSG